ncbi:hypothetical protein NADFUDRAFT_82157, partial [Nadsonia fulvescens var. elongata DSM 6958]
MPPKRSSNMGITRAIYACQRCRSRKIRCDQNFPSCKSCKDAGVECIGVDAATGKVAPRSYVSYLEERVAYLESRLKSKGQATVGLDGGVAPQADVAAVQPQDSTQLQSPVNTNSGSNNINEVSKGVDDLTISYIGPASGISFARLLITALKFRDNNKIRHDKAEFTNIVPETPLSSNASSPSVPSFQLSPVTLPSKEMAETLTSLYFSQANPQLPLVHREQFLNDHFIPVYGPLSPLVSLASDNSTPSSDNPNVKSEASAANSYTTEKLTGQSAKLDPPHKPTKLAKSYYFLFMIFGIATTIHHQRHHADTSDAYRVKAMEYSELVFSSTDRLEALQGILLLTLYSIMRPTAPGVWYTLSSALRLCVDLGLHTENVRPMTRVFEGKGGNDISGAFFEKPSHIYDAYTLDKRRRLFWCTYSLDRQISIYLGRPFGIPDESIKVPMPSLLDDSYITPDNTQISDYSDLEQIRNSNIAHALTEPSYKTISLGFVKIRQIQAEVQRILYDCADIPRKFQSFQSWNDSIAQRLRAWYESCPKSPTVMNCDFNTELFNLNYHQTRLLLHGLSPANLSLSEDSYSVIADSGKNIIKSYEYLNSRLMINYTWVAVHNLFMGGTSYLYALYSSWDVRNATSIEEINFYISSCKKVLSSLTDRCHAAVESMGTFKILAAAVLSLVMNEQSEKLRMKKLSSFNAKKNKSFISSREVFTEGFVKKGKIHSKNKPCLFESAEINFDSDSNDLGEFFKEVTQSERSSPIAYSLCRDVTPSTAP